MKKLTPKQITISIYSIMLFVFISINLLLIKNTKSIINHFDQIELNQQLPKRFDNLLFLNEKLGYTAKKFIKTSDSIWLKEYYKTKKYFNQKVSGLNTLKQIPNSISDSIFKLEQQSFLANANHNKKQALLILESDLYFNYKNQLFNYIEKAYLNHQNLTNQLITDNSIKISSIKKNIKYFMFSRILILLIISSLGYYIYKSFKGIKKLNSELIVSEQKFRNTITNLLEGYYTATLDGKLLSYNNEFEKTLGLDPSINHKGSLILNFWQDPKERELFISKIKEQGYVKNFIVNATKLDKTPFVAMVNARLVTNPSNNTETTEGTFLDVTAERNAEIKLQETLNSHQKLINSSIQGLFRIATTIPLKTDLPVKEQINFFLKNAYIAECNDLFAQFYGFKSALEITNKPLTVLWESEETALELIKLYISSQYEWVNITTEETTANGEVKFFLNNIVSLYKSETEIEGCWVSSIDITDRIKAEKEIQKSEERNNFALAVNNDGYYDWDISSNNVYYDSRYYTMAGYQPNEFPGNAAEWEKRVHIDDIDRVQTKTANFLSGISNCYDEEFRFKQKNGEWMWIRSRIKTFETDKHGKPKRAIGTHTDITYQKTAEIALRESEQKFKNFMYNAPDAMYVHDITGNICNTNVKATQDLGYTKKEIKSLTVFDIDAKSNKSDKDLVINTWKQLETNKRISISSFHIRKDGSTFPVEIQLSAFFNKGEKMFLAFVRDLTNRKKTEEETNKLTKALEQSPICIMITDFNGDLEYVNPCFEKTTGYSYKEVLGKNPRILNSGHHPKEYYKTMWNFLYNGKPWEGEIKNKKKNGELYWENVNIAPIKNDENQITHFVALKEDITEKKKILEDLEKAKNKAEESDRLKTAFLTSMSHEIRTPLNSIVGFSNVIADESTRPEFKEFTTIINNQSEILLQLVDDLIYFARIESESIEIKETTFDINSLLEEIFQTYDNKCNSKVNLVLKTHYSKMIIYSDKNRVKQIFINLLSNAIKFTHKGNITFGYELDVNNNIVCFVNDTGIGVSLEKQSKIFERFFKIDDFSQGTGLGLSIVAKVLDLMKGEIKLTSEIEKGSEFRFTIPFKIEEVVNISSEKNTNNKLFTVLIAEDNESNFTYLKQILSNEVDHIIWALNGSEAIAFCKDNKNIDLVLMDLKMPIINGWEATEQIRKLKPKLPIIAQTAHTFRTDEEKLQKLKFNEYISKPISKESLIKLVHKYKPN
ncbi:PAS domain S-box-containing protein [Wenyingzhuangia heitensis]|uniref:histidine kinase n=1 Tax=Wenyingzhuangia heitensis TaxID=1487859 RepID=A0ABX0UD37_9FLAO|nr:PAS domain S-box protein [Wenyingzhuangia heitensis]NIJ45456.1 PAS domain S-box-containing protein [Wenyingzhuangia heitensis]